MTRSLSGQTILITGGGGGLGQSISYALAREGARLVIADIVLESATRVVERIIEGGGTAIALRSDVTDETQVNELFQESIARFGQVHVLVNNAAIPGPTSPFTQTSVDDWDAVFAANVRGVFLCCRAVVPHMIRHRDGHIVNISSATAHVGATRIRSIPYTTTKFAIEGLTWTLSVSLQEHGIRVNAIRPSLTITNFHAHSPREYFTGVRCWAPDHIVGPMLETLTELEGTGQSIDAATWHEARGTTGQVSFVHA